MNTGTLVTSLQTDRYQLNFEPSEIVLQVQIHYIEGE